MSHPLGVRELKPSGEFWAGAIWSSHPLGVRELKLIDRREELGLSKVAPFRGA